MTSFAQMALPVSSEVHRLPRLIASAAIRLTDPHLMRGGYPPALTTLAHIRASNVMVTADLATTYDHLAARLKTHGFKETEASIANKLARATMSAAFFLACLAAMGVEGWCWRKFSPLALARGLLPLCRATSAHCTRAIKVSHR